MPKTKLDFEKKMCEYLERLKETIESNSPNQVRRIAQKMERYAIFVHAKHPDFLRDMEPREWLESFVNGKLR